MKYPVMVLNEHQSKRSMSLFECDKRNIFLLSSRVKSGCERCRLWCTAHFYLYFSTDTTIKELMETLHLLVSLPDLVHKLGLETSQEVIVVRK